MGSGKFSVELDGRRVIIDQQVQEVRVMDLAGLVVSRERLQIAAGSIQGIFSSLQEVTDVTTIGAPRRNA